jgi:hypothetical protein
MEEQQSAAYYKRLIDEAASYHDLVVFRSRFFSLIDRTLPKDEAQEVKDCWNARAKDENLPIAPAAKG